MVELRAGGFKRLAIGVCMALAVTGLGGCSLLTPSRADVAPEEVRTKLSSPAIATSGTLAVALPRSSSPLIMEAEDGSATGYLADVARLLGRKLGLSVTFELGGDADSVGSAGGADIYLGATAEDAAAGITFSEGVLENAPALFALDGSVTGSLSAANLAGAQIAVQSGSNSADVLSKSGIEATAVPCANVNECMKALVEGRASFALTDAAAGAYIARAYEGVGLVGTIGEETSYGIALRSTNAELARVVSDALDEMASDGTLAAVHAAWFGKLPVDLEGMAVAGLEEATEPTSGSTGRTVGGASDDDADADSPSSSDADDAADSDATSPSQAGVGTVQAAGVSVASTL